MKIKFDSFPVFSVLALGAIGFLSGFLGPMIFNPDANQGPLFGIFFTGPASALLGAIIGILITILGLKKRSKAIILISTSIIIIGVVLYMCMPEPKYLGTIIDAEIHGSQAPNSLIAGRIRFWQDPNSSERCDYQRVNWEKDVDRMLKEEKTGVVLTVYVYRYSDIFEHRKPWNKGSTYATKWIIKNKVENYYARLTRADIDRNLLPHSRHLFFPKYEDHKVCPPDNLPSFLGLLVLEQVPNEYLIIN